MTLRTPLSRIASPSVSRSNRRRKSTCSGFVGQINVLVAADDGIEQATTEFTVAVANHSPVFPVIGDPAITNADGSLTVALLASDADGDDLICTAEVIQPDVWQLDEAPQSQASDNFHTNWGGQNERWLRREEGWYFILEDRGFYRWPGNFKDSVQLAEVSASDYADPNRIADAQPLAVTTSMTGNSLTIEADEDQTRISGCEFLCRMASRQ